MYALIYDEFEPSMREKKVISVNVSSHLSIQGETIVQARIQKLIEGIVKFIKPDYRISFEIF